MNAISPNRVVITGKNRAISPTAFQDAANVAQSEPGMEFYMAFIHARQACEYLLFAHAARKASDAGGESFNHVRASRELDKAASILGRALVDRENVVVR